MAVVSKNENLEENPEGNQLEIDSYGEIFAPESDALFAQSPNRDFRIAKISETVQGMVTE